MQTTIFSDARPHLLAVATRMLGSPADAEEAVQETWLRAADVGDEIENPTGWLTTVVSRICLDMLRARRPAAPVEIVDPVDQHPGPADEAQLADAVSAALGAVLDSLAPAERVAFVLHDVFGVPFDDVATILGKTPAATRQVASRARRRVTAAPPESTSHRTRAVDAFLAASRDGDFGSLVELLDPDAMFRTFTDDQPPALVHGAPAIAEAFMFRAKTAYTALLDGKVGVAVRHPSGRDGEVLLVMDVSFTPSGGIAAIDATLRGDELTVVEVRRAAS
ncbi:sigma-70 family RNA polymerase sigma factor [Gordonia phthalatica]|uniref:RNA polymerase sigma factor n=1 Tax=Gordonia phthalatica TaxID=1136941 RepID=A0A0N9NDQ8_9ACTN|nr:sigma-70 family RNA polymerase sigma factor [Gordonia phthalatica]ALG83280.1 RNA polymerase sigma factor [Gordonia phthalatica]